MATAKEYFENAIDFEFGVEFEFRSPAGEKIIVPVKSAFDFEAGAKYIKIYIPDISHPDQVAASIIRDIDTFWNEEKMIEMTSGFSGTSEAICSRDLVFTGRITVWTPSVIEQARWGTLKEQMASGGFSLVVRDGNYVKMRDSLERPMAFISHDSRDKEPFVKELAQIMSRSLCPVWYDEYSLKPGNSLRASIEGGLKSCPKCILILSPNFFENEGWARREFDTIYTREMIEKTRLMIPVWLEVTKEQVFEFSPILADIMGLPSDLGVEEVARRLVAILNSPQ